MKNDDNKFDVDAAEFSAFHARIKAAGQYIFRLDVVKTGYRATVLNDPRLNRKAPAQPDLFAVGSSAA